MAKKYRVKYAFGTPAVYNEQKLAGKLDEYTVYFIADENEEIGTIYRGAIKIGTAKASELIFDQNFTIVLAQASEEGDEDLTITINKGSTLVDVVSDLYKREYNDFANLSDKIDILNGTGEGSVIDTINDAIIEKTTGPDSELYSRTEADRTFFRLDQVDSLEAIAEIMSDPEKMAQLVDAAQHITDALEPYYTKEEIHRILLGEGNLNIIQTYDSSSQFPLPADANKNVFYVDDEENIVYRWGLNEEGDAREYVEISGSGSGASSEIKLETNIFVRGGKTTVSIAKGTNLEVEFVFSSANTMMQYNKRTKEFEKIQQQIGTTASVKYLLDGVQFDSGSIKQGNYYEDDDTKNVYNKVTVPAAKFNASLHELKIIATDVAGNSATETITVNVVSANITSSYVVTPTSLDHEISIPVTVTSTGDSELFYTIDGEEPIKVQDVPVGSPVINVVVPPTGREHGYHTIKIWATTYIEESDTTISTRVLSYDVIWYDTNNPLPIITTSYDIDPDDEGKYNVTQYEYATLTYQVYPASTVDLILHDITAGLIRVVNTLNVDTIAKSWTYTFDTVGEYELYVNVHYGDGEILASKKYDVVVAKSEISMDATPGSVLYYTAKNRSNDEANPAIWRDEVSGLDASLTGFLWNSNSGWSTDGATTSLKVAGGAKCEIPFYPFGRDYRSTGQVFEVDFSTSNLADSTAEVIKCYSETDKSGIVITATGAYFASAEFGETTDGDARIFVPFKENERVRLSFVITPWLSDEEGHSQDSEEAIVNLWDGTKYTPMNSITLGWWRFVKIYLNGVCIGIHNYSGGFMQTNKAPIVIGSDKATVNIYSLRVYNTVLYDRAIVNNFIADTQDPAEKLRLFKRNNILNEAGTDVESSSLRRLMPCIFITCQTDATASGIVNNEHILPTNKADKRGVTIFFDCDGLNDEAREYYKFCHTFVAFNVQFAVQGTSSQYYPRRNWKATLKPQKKFTADYVANSTSSKPTYLFYDIPWETSIAEGRDARAAYVNKYKDQYSNKYQLKDYSEEFSGIADDKRTVDEISSIPAKKFCLKADFAESSGTHNTGFAKYVDVILKSLGYDYLTPPQKTQYNKTRNMVDVTFRTSVDGYPIAMFWRPTFEDDWEFYGKFNFNLDKGAESVFGFIDLSDGGITDEDINPMTGQPYITFDEDYYDAANQDERLLYESPVECWEFTNNSTDLCKFRNVTETSFTEKTIDADGKTETPLWLGSFEVRHPDNDNLIDLDYGTGLKVPTHWSKFCQWVSSTDRTGYHNNDKNLPVPTAWTGTYDELIAGSTDKEIFAVYEGKLSEMIEAPVSEFDINRRYILQPVAVDPGDGTISPDQSYPLYGHIVHYNITTSPWYDSTKELNTWVDDGVYEEEESNVDYTKAYFISNQSDANNSKVYSYNKNANTWDNIANISQYALPAPVVYNTISYSYDTAEYRFAKFKNELQYHMNIPMTTAYYVLTEFFCCADQRAKNMMFASWGYEPGAGNVRPANAYANETEAAAAGYKPVYKYEIGTVAGASKREILAANNDITGVVINEIHPDGKKMEFYNTTDKAIALNGFVLKGVDDSGAARENWSFPITAQIAAKGYYTITFKSNDITLGPNYGLSAKKAWTFTLENGAGAVVDTVSHDGHNLGTKSLGRKTDGVNTWVEFDYPTIGEPNEASTIVENVAPTNVCFNEVDANGTNGDKFVELYNPTGVDVNLDGWTLKKGDTVVYENSDAGIANVENDKSLTFTSAAVIPAGGYFTVIFKKKTTKANEMPSGISADGGFVLRLYNASSELVAELNNSKYNDDGSERDEFVNFRSNLRGYEVIARDPANNLIWRRSSASTPTAANDIQPAVKSNLDGTPVAAAELITTDAVEFSGIARTPNGQDFYAVGDGGGVFRVSEDGSTRLIAEYRASNDENYPANFEGLTKDDQGNYYAIDEFTRDLIKFSNNMLFAEVIDTIPEPENATGSNSYEGIAYYEDGKFFLGHQDSPTALYLYDTSSNDLTLVKNLDCVSEIADIYYDGTYVWVVDSKKCYICKCTITGDLVEKYVVSNATGKNPEAILVEDDYTWLGCDGGGATGNYLIKVTLAEQEGGGEGGDDQGDDLDPGEIITDHIVINEINGTTKMIEFYNPTGSAVTLGGSYGLLKTDTDAFGADDWYTFPAGAVIPAHGYFTICADKSQSGDDGALHTLFGISLNPGKVFHIYLVKYAAGFDATSIEGILNTGIVVDDVDNMTKPVNYAEKDMGWSYGRIANGSKNFTMFSTDSMAATTGASTDAALANENGTPAGGEGGGGEEGETTTIKTVLYWVPANAEYIYYPIFYDNDTILSLDNTGHIKFNPNVESTDRVGTGYAYNGTESVLWLNFKDAFDAEITATYVNMRSRGGLTYQNCMKYFNEGQSDQWPENVYNIDGKFKYVIPATKGYIDYSTQDTTGKYGVTLRNSSYLYECQGSREEHRKWWLNNRFTYMDSRYFAVSYAEDYATIRLYTPSIWEGVTPSSTFKLTPYADMYLRVMFGQIVSTVRAEKNKTYDVTPSDPNLRFNDTETIIYGASNILSFGDMTNKYAGSVAIDKASKITDIILGADVPYYNENITAAGLTVGAGNSTLKTLDLRGCTKLTNVSGLNQITSIEKIFAQRTGITSFDFSTAGVNLNEIHYPNTIAEIKLVNMKNISYSNIDIPNYSNLKSVWIENCPQLVNDSWRIVNNILNTPGNILSAARIVGFEWNITTKAAYEVWKKLLKLSGFTASGIQEYTVPYLSGTVNIGGEVVVSTGYKAAVEALFADAGGLTVNVANTVGLSGIEIIPDKNILDYEGIAQIVPGVEYTFNVSYLPDDFVLPSERGVTWDCASALTVISSDANSIKLAYVGSTGGNNLYRLKATSISNPAYSTILNIRPSATLSMIKVTDTTGREIQSAVNINEGESVTFNIDFIPEGTTDTDVVLTAVNGTYLDYSYDSHSRTLTVTGKDVDQNRRCSITIRSANVNTVSTTIDINVLNVVSRIIKLKNGAGDYIPGYIDVRYTDKFTGEPALTRFITESGIISLRTDGSCGFSELVINAESSAAADGEVPYNKPAAVTIPELPTSATSDVEKEIVFYEPINARITIKNAGAPVVDRTLRIDSLDNQSIRELTTPPYNRILAGQSATPSAGSPMTIKLLANTTHNIVITELDSHGDLVVNGGRYSQYNGIITTGTSDVDYTITISRDYLGGDINYETELHMTVVTGSALTNAKTVRLYVKAAGDITIDWGDKEDYQNSTDASQWTTRIDGITHDETHDYSFNKEIAIYHTYTVYEKEYDISVKENTGRIRWFHVIPENATEMRPCMGTTASGTGFDSSWAGNAKNVGGIVAYQSSGAAVFSTMPRFNITNAENKSYSKLLCVGNIYRNCTDCTNADSLFENTTLEQLYPNLIFENCANITSFNRTFKNSNVTSIPANFFISNRKAVSFEETFMNCTNLSSINSQEDTPFVNPDTDIEIQSFVRMFKGCNLLSSEVPALWKTFYGCSFNVITNQMTFDGCEKVYNFTNIPATWGGNVNKTYVESEYKRLKYIRFDGNQAGNPGDPIYYSFNGIFPKGQWRYELDFKPLEAGWGIQPLLGTANGVAVSGDHLDPTAVNKVVDYSRGGLTNGSQTPSGQGGSGTYTGYFNYHANDSLVDAWRAAKTLNSDQSAVVFTGDYGGENKRVILDISHTEEGYVVVYPAGTNKQDTMKKYNIEYWDNLSDFVANQPLLFMQIYNDYPYNPTSTSAELLEDWNNRIAHINYDNGQYWHGRFITFYELNVYDETNKLIHNFVPVYGQHPITAKLQHMLWDSITNEVFANEGSYERDGNATYYSKNNN